jgi:hypothetical protein
MYTLEPLQGCSLPLAFTRHAGCYICGTEKGVSVCHVTLNDVDSPLHKPVIFSSTDKGHAKESKGRFLYMNNYE